MKFEHRTITLKDGRTCVLCPTYPEYAEEMIEYLVYLIDSKVVGFIIGFVMKNTGGKANSQKVKELISKVF